uniref:Uncharacterized protein n=1 Tax=Candidatus Kentrum sp. LFY TaxID=2126342 RepID=A0A450UTF4_9GAMM|nr:MAG: hypothetical protein BECKLFY1418A_GA0070994_105316 [Candidatus Kentron sp. LFY]
MNFDIEKSSREIDEFFEHSAHRAYVEATQPNDGEDIAAICEKGLSQFETNFHALYAALTDGMK